VSDHWPHWIHRECISAFAPWAHSPSGCRDSYLGPGEIGKVVLCTYSGYNPIKDLRVMIKLKESRTESVE